VNSDETSDIYNQYRGTSPKALSNIVDSDAQNFLDSEIVPVCKMFSMNDSNVQTYLASRGYTDPNYTTYVAQQMK
jgi:hypothetical protein